MKTQTIIFFAVASLLFYGCKTGVKNAGKNDISFDSIQVEKVYHLLDNPENPNCNFQLKFIFPVKMGDKNLLTKIQKQFVSDYFGDEYGELSPEEATAKYTEEYLNSYKELEDDFNLETQRSEGKQIPSWFSYYEMSENEICYNSNQILSYSVNFNNYTGGAHGAHSTRYHVIDLRTGNKITEDAIFVEDYQDQLAPILVDKIAELNNVQDAKELENIGFFSVDEIYPNGNFLIDDTGITYAFNEYEIAAYVLGLIEVRIPFKEIEYLLRKDSPISHLIF
ncbi:MAG: DUF3298 domain-containing protein [Massilibacteroides sp.]|nr:DUF3298 domain-containing protein [Massilibacteroides sp.]MDD3061472.1 DUF3298 domain-containing protein [Massilibacteroides sp.]MDD4114547.1 DUF3298 domain-containing protein [Massilibacteroides sp.]MDD4659238.1 DUF3298 domain-containing protein [Massilibacteroides sp.]